MNIPMKRLYTGSMMPGIGLGTFGSDHVSAEDVAKAVAAGIEMGYRYIYLETHTNLAAAIHEYERSGYRRVDRPPTVVHTTMDRFYVKELS